MLFGFYWPKIVFFCSECPSTIFVIGILIGAIPKVNKIVYIFLSIGAIISGGTFGFQGAWFDIAYFASGIIAIIIFIKYWNKIKGKNQ